MATAEQTGKGGKSRESPLMDTAKTGEMFQLEPKVAPKLLQVAVDAPLTCSHCVQMLMKCGCWISKNCTLFE